MIIDLDEKDLKHGLLGLVIALVEIIIEALKLQAIRRMEGSGLTDAEVERLGEALMDLDTAIEKMKADQGLAESVKAVRDGLDDVVNEVIDSFLIPTGCLESQQAGTPQIQEDRRGFPAPLGAGAARS